MNKMNLKDNKNFMKKKIKQKILNYIELLLIIN